ncbi:MAG: hypothetical protein DYG89_46795 [Caldilinea sp. CFX5]|nr:hypothetical protein [Caldilinea sp. CFX5]
MIRLFFFGAPQIAQATATPPLHLTPKAMALWVYLAVTAAQGRLPHRRDVLANLLWSETNNAQARTNLRYLLPELRQPLADYLLITPRTICFNAQRPYWLDVEQVRATLTAPAESVNHQTLQSALDLYQGEFLAGFTVRNAPVFEEWLRQERESLHTLVVHGAYRLADYYWRQLDYLNALATTRRLLGWEPWHEAAHRLQMQLLAATGQRAAALAQYTLCRQLLADELGATPEAATTALYEQLRRSAPDKAPGDKRTGDNATGGQGDKVTVDKPVTQPPCHPVTMSLPNNLPRQATSFIGRTSEVADLCVKVLAPDCRLLTLVGEGGIGKTRLALAVAQRILDFGFSIFDSTTVASTNKPKSKFQNQKFPDGIWFVPLADFTAGSNLMDQIATAVATTIGLQFSGHQPLLTQVVAQMRHKALLLLFDNVEHLLPTVGDCLLPILQSCPHITILVTSRHVLNLQVESIWRVHGLIVPPLAAGATLAPATLLDYSSIALFVERAQRSNPAFQLTASNKAAIVAICQLFEGLPLALELAAVHTKAYRCVDLYQALQHDYTMLVSTEEQRLPQQRSIQAMLAYSWRFLSPEEWRALAACAIFAGGFTRTAMLTVTGAAPVHLATLLDQSLLQMSEGRFTMHALVRHYAATQLAHSPVCQARIAAAHAAYYIDLLHSLEGALVVDFAAQQSVQSEIENIRAAWRWAVEQRNLALLAKGLESLYYFFRLTGLYREAIQLLETAQNAVRTIMAAAPADTPPLSLLARLLCHMAEFYRRLSGGETGVRLAQEALSLGRQLADPALQALAYHRLARLAYTRNQFLHMRDLAAEGARQAQQAGLPHLLAECLNDMGLATSACTGPLTALPYCQQALAVLHGAANRILEAFILVNLGYFSLASGQYQVAATYLQQGLAMQRLLQDRGGRIAPLVHLLNLWLALGVYEALPPLYAEAEALVQTIGNLYWESNLQISHGRWQQGCGDAMAAHVTYTNALQLAQASRDHVQEQLALVYLGHTLTNLGKAETAYVCYQQAIGLHKADSWLYRTADAHAGLAALLFAQNRLREAISEIEAALAHMAQHGLAGANEPFTVYWTAVRVFRAANDPRADTVLRSAYQALQEIAAQLTDDTWRRSFLEDVVVNRHLLAAAQNAGVT